MDPLRDIQSFIKIPAVLTQWKRISYSCVLAYSVQEMRPDSGSSLCKSFCYDWPKAQVTVCIPPGCLDFSIATGCSQTGYRAAPGAPWAEPGISKATHHLIGFVLGINTLLCAGKGKKKQNQLMFPWPKKASSETSMSQKESRLERNDWLLPQFALTIQWMLWQKN